MDRAEALAELNAGFDSAKKAAIRELAQGRTDDYGYMHADYGSKPISVDEPYTVEIQVSPEAVQALRATTIIRFDLTPYGAALNLEQLHWVIKDHGPSEALITRDQNQSIRKELTESVSTAEASALPVSVALIIEGTPEAETFLEAFYAPA